MWQQQEGSKALSQILYEFSNDLGPSDEFKFYGKQHANRIFEMLQQQSKFKLARPCISGSMGRKTGIMTSDFDLIIFVNDQVPLFTNVIKEWEYLVSKFLDVTKLSSSKFGVTFLYQGYSFDLLPATNHVNHYSPRKRLAAKQAFKVYKTIQKTETKPEWHSTALCETQKRFMRKQSSFIHGLVRLSKFWEKSTFTSGYISGRSTLIELIAVFAGQEEEEECASSGETLSMLRAFKNFLNLILDFDDMRIEFPLSVFDPLKPIEHYHFRNWEIDTDLVDEDLRSPPFVIEPANPYNNLARGLRRGQIENLKQSAQETLNRLDGRIQNFDLWNPSYSRQRNSDLNLLDYIFAPPAEWVPVNFQQIRNQLENADFRVSCSVYDADEEGGFRCMSTKTMWSDFDTPEWKSTLKNLEKLFYVVSRSFVSDYSRKCDYSVDLDALKTALRNRMEKCIDENVWGNEEDDEEWDSIKGWSTSDVLFKIPVEIPGNQGKICISIRFNLDDDDE